MIKITDLTFYYTTSATPIFEHFSWQTGPAESWAVIGPSGCGKTTLLYLVAGLRQAISGKIEVAGQAIVRPRPETGLIIQDFGLLPWATVRQNVSLGLRIRRFYGPDGRHAPKHVLPTDILACVEHWLTRLGIGTQADKFASQLSGGQRQRTAIARTLVLEPDLLLMDEPFSALDAPTREDLQQVVARLTQETGIATLIVTHNIEEAVYMGEKILVLAMPPNIEPQVVENPAARTPGFRNSTSFVVKVNEIRGLMGLVA